MYIIPIGIRIHIYVFMYSKYNACNASTIKLNYNYFKFIIDENKIWL